MNDRLIRILNELIAKHGKTFVGEEMGYKSNSQLNKLLKGQALPSTQVLCRLIYVFGINANYIFTGKGEIFNGEDKSESRMLPVIFEGIEYYGINAFDCRVVDLKTTKDGGGFFTCIPISDLEFRKTHNCKCWVDMKIEKKYTHFTIYNDWGTPSIMCVPNYMKDKIDKAIEGAIEQGLM